MNRSSCTRVAGWALLVVGLGLCGPLAGCVSSQGPSARDRADALAQVNDARAQLERQKAEAVELATRAEAAAQRGRQTEAIELYRQALSRWNRVPMGYNNLGVLLYEQGQYAEAVDALEIATVLEPDDPRPLRNLGLLWMTVDYPSRAYEVFQEALDRDPTHLESLRGIVGAADALIRADEQLLAYVREALLRESDPIWRDYLNRQLYRIQQTLEVEG